VKPFPAVLGDMKLKEAGMSGCSVLGDGSITIILDVQEIMSN
jgi:two-component system chemotaxis sensor kinase CheA